MIEIKERSITIHCLGMEITFYAVQLSIDRPIEECHGVMVAMQDIELHYNKVRIYDFDFDFQDLNESEQNEILNKLIEELLKQEK